MKKEAPLILIIDDEESMRDSCSLILTKEGYQTATAPDGETGLQLLRQLKPDLALVDLKMPGISGFDVLEQAKEIDPHIVQVVITGYATVESAVEAMKKGAYDFLPKPFTPDELRIIIRRGLERRRLTLEKEALEREKRLMEENFITMVSHQLKSPLVVILQYFEVILSGVVQDETQKLEMLKKAKDRLEGLLELINDWLDIARMDKGQIIERRKPLHLYPLLKEIIEFMKPLAEEKKVSLKLFPLEKGDTVWGDGETLKEVFSNLIHNAIKYNKPQGEVRVKIQEEPPWIRIEVADTGIGIAREHLPLIFEQFYRVKNNREEKKSDGSGLGLAIAKKIVEAHEGRIEVVSEINQGTCFSVYLPQPPTSPSER
jgi:signal transduction histidine kinase